jgi:hypothetical protein
LSSSTLVDGCRHQEVSDDMVHDTITPAI